MPFNLDSTVGLLDAPGFPSPSVVGARSVRLAFLQMFSRPTGYLQPYLKVRTVNVIDIARGLIYLACNLSIVKRMEVVIQKGIVHWPRRAILECDGGLLDSHAGRKDGAAPNIQSPVPIWHSQLLSGGLICRLGRSWESICEIDCNVL